MLSWVSKQGNVGLYNSNLDTEQTTRLGPQTPSILSSLWEKAPNPCLLCHPAGADCAP